MGESLHLTSEYLAQEAKVEFALSHVTTLEAENLKLKKELIAAMNEANLAKEKVKTLIDEGFELLRRYFIKHPSGVDLEKRDLEEVDKEMATDKAA